MQTEDKQKGGERVKIDVQKRGKQTIVRVNPPAADKKKEPKK